MAQLFELHIRTAKDWDDFQDYYQSILSRLSTTTVGRAIAGDFVATVPPIHIRDNLNRLYAAHQDVCLNYHLRYEAKWHCSQIKVKECNETPPSDIVL
jgi:hypothetical protein